MSGYWSGYDHITTAPCSHAGLDWRSDCFPIRGYERVTVTRILAHRGKGTEEDPHRNVTVWLDDNGMLIAYRDPWAEEQSQERGSDDD